MEPTTEIRRLLDLMPASGRMMTRIVSKPAQAKVIDSSFPLPWSWERPILINFELWRRLPQPQRDLLLLSHVAWLTGVRWFKPDIYQGVAIAGLLGSMLELWQQDVIGVTVAAGLSTIACGRIWQNNRSSQALLTADANALRIAQRRGYNEQEAAKHLLSGIEAVARLENRPALDFIDLLRCQNLRAILGLSAVDIPHNLKNQV